MYIRRLALLAVAMIPAFTINAQDTLNYDAITLNDLLNMKIGVASLKELSASESPGIITVISGEEIRQSGARDLMEVLESVPGFHFGEDVQSVVGLGVRGNWAHEGKALLLIDGQVMNEGLYSSLQFGNHYPVSGIKRIEIIRGPGSVIYGDYAEYAVINIITQTANDINGVQATADYGWMKQSYARRGGSFSAGKAGNGYSFDIKASYLEGNRSDDIYTDVFGTTTDFTGNSKLDNTFLNIGMGYKNFSFKGIADFYHTTSSDEYDAIAPAAVPHTFDSYFLELSHDLKIGRKINLVNRVNYKYQLPWRVEEAASEEYNIYMLNYNRYTYTGIGQWDINDNLNFMLGVESFYDRSENETEEGVFATTGTNVLDYYNTAVFSQVLWKNKIATVTAGARQNFNSEFSSSLVPRFGITKKIGNFHVKMLYSLSYRSPSAENINYGINLEPEVTRVAEIEAGYQFTKNLYVVCNAFDVLTKNIIIYYYDWDNGMDTYVNKDRSGTQGIEAEVKYITNALNIRAGYSWYTAGNKPMPEEYAVPGNSKSMLAFPNDKAYIILTTSSKRKLQASVQTIFTGKQHFISGWDGAAPVYSTLNPTFKTGASVSYCGLLNKGISVTAGVYNLLNEKEIYIQPYNSLHAPIPGRGREYRIQLSYQWNRSDK
jgi:outer membrane cobalamin receptor